MRERLLGRVPDPDRIPVDPVVANARMSRADAAKFNSAEFLKFRQQNSDVFFNEELIDQLGNYFDKNGIGIVTCSMLAALVTRYAEANLLPDSPAAEPEPEPEPTQEPAPTEAKPEVFDGWCLQSGEPRTYSAREVDRMSADEYRRAFRLYSDNLSLPNLGPGARWTGRDRESRL